MERLNYFSPLPPIKSGISDYSAELLEELSKYFDITAYTDSDLETKKNKSYRIIKLTKEVKLEESPYLYNVGNHHTHSYIYNLLQKKKGIIILHDFNISDLAFSMQKKYWTNAYFLKEVFWNHGIFGLFNYLKLFKSLDLYEEYDSSKKTNAFLTKQWYRIEKDEVGNFRWTTNRSGFIINENNVTDISITVQSELPALLTIRINDISINRMIISNSIKVINISLSASKSVRAELRVVKPFSFLSKIIYKDSRNLGVKIYEIKFKADNKINILNLLSREASEAREMKSKFLRIKEKIKYLYPMNKGLIKSAKAIIIHSKYLKREVRKIDSKIPLIVINEGVSINKPNISKEKLKIKLKLDKYDFIVCSFGLIQKHKRIEQAMEAFSKFSSSYPKSIYLLIGEFDETVNIMEIIKRVKLQGKVLVLGYLPFMKAIEYIRASDVSINLRYPSTGATSASLIKSLSIGTPCIISDIPENQEFPLSCVFKIKKDEEEIDNIVKTLQFLKENPDLVKRMSVNSLDYIGRNHLWKDKAREISDYIKKIYMTK